MTGRSALRLLLIPISDRSGVAGTTAGRWKCLRKWVSEAVIYIYIYTKHIQHTHILLMYTLYSQVSTRLFIESTEK